MVHRASPDKGARSSGGTGKSSGEPAKRHRIFQAAGQNNLTRDIGNQVSDVGHRQVNGGTLRMNAVVTLCGPAARDGMLFVIAVGKCGPEPGRCAGTSLGSSQVICRQAGEKRRG